MREKRTKHSPSYKAEAALEALEGVETIAEFANRSEVHPNRIRRWKNASTGEDTSSLGGNGKQKKEDASPVPRYTGSSSDSVVASWFIESLRRLQIAGPRSIMSREHLMRVSSQQTEEMPVVRKEDSYGGCQGCWSGSGVA